MFAAHDAADVVDHRIVGNNGHARLKRIGLAVERQNLLAVLRFARNQCPGKLCTVIDVQRTAKVNRDEIGDIDQRRNRFLANRLELAGHPFRRCAIGNAGYALRIKCRATIGVVGTHFRRLIGSVNRRQRGHPVNLG